MEEEQELSFEELADIDVKSLTREEKENLFRVLMKRQVQRARTDFYTYVRLMAPFMLPEGFVDGKHIEFLCKELQEVFEAVIDPVKLTNNKLMVSLPPGGMKSTLAVRLLSSWCFGRKPNFRCIAIGHSTTFAAENYGRPVRNFMRTQEYQEVFPEVEITKDAASAVSWETTAGGTFISAGAGSGIAGRRAHISFVDDVLSEQTAYSKTERTRVNNWYVPGLRSRLLPKSGEIIIGTRYMEDDLIGFLLKTEAKSKHPWKYFSIPALLNKEVSDIFRKNEPEDSQKYLVGTSFWPELWSTEKLMDYKESPSMTLSTWNAMYQQNPTPAEGNIIKREQFKWWTKKDPPPLEFLLISLDTAFSTKETADYSVIQVWGVFIEYKENSDGEMCRTPNIILIDNERGRWDFPDLCNKVREKENEYKPDAYLIEKKASGQSLIQELRRWGFPVLEFLPDRDKIARVHACTPFFSAGRIFVPEHFRWAEELVEEACAFPYAANDDQTDALSQTVLWLRDSYQVGSEGYSIEDYEDTMKPAKSYWSSLAG